MKVRRALLCLACAAVVAATGMLVYRMCRPCRIMLPAPDEAKTAPIVPDPLGSADQRGAAGPLGIQLEVGTDGAYVWEAEWANRIQGTYKILDTQHTSGGMALWQREGAGRNIGDSFYEKGCFAPNPHLEQGIADWYFDLPRGGRYQLYARIWAMNACGNSAWCSVDDITDMRYFPGGTSGPYGQDNGYWPEEMFQRWLWILDHGVVYDLAEGPHHIRIAVREDGLAIDQLALVPEGAPPPTGIRRPTLRPGIAPATTEVRPVEASLCLSKHVLTDSSLKAAGNLWMRLNVNEPVDVSAVVTAASAVPSTGSPFSCRLTPEHPVAVVPVRITFPDKLARRGHRVVATVKIAGQSDITCVQPLVRPFQWWVVMPATTNRVAGVGHRLRVAAAADTAHLLDIGAPYGKWIPVDPARHYDEHGTIDLLKAFGLEGPGPAFAVTRIHVDRSGDYLVFGGADDTLLLAVGSRVILSDRTGMPLVDTLRARQVSLKAGEYQLVAEIGQTGGEWQMRAEFRNLDGTPTSHITGLPMLQRKAAAPTPVP